MNIAILGAGAWGTALAIALANSHRVTLWVRDAAQAAALAKSRQNARYLPGYDLPANITIESDSPRAGANCDLAILVPPTNSLREVLTLLRSSAGDRPLVWGCKGFEASTGKLPHAVVQEVLGDAKHVGALSGPSFAQEVAAGKPAALTLASTDSRFAVDTARALHGSRMRVYSSEDVIGVEVGGAVKNVMAIAAGICDGMALGHNARAALITRGLAEITRLGLKLGGKLETFMGLAGLGDLVLTCTGDLSRNRQVGLQLAQGETLADILRRLGHVAEGVHTARAVDQLARALTVDMPITDAVCRILHENVPAQQALQELMRREPKAELISAK
jgi:glycerol-3-phosphate dehydrogenase (NAD(P)+)